MTSASAAPARAVSSDWEGLMAAAQGGDARAYERLLRELRPALSAIARSRLAGRADVEDAVQDTLLAIHRLRHTYDPARPLRPWAAAICERRCVDLLRRAGRAAAWHRPVTAMAEALPEPRAAEAALRRIEAIELRAAIAELPPVQRLAIRLGKLEQLPLAEAGARCGRGSGALRVATHRAMRALRLRLAPAHA